MLDANAKFDRKFVVILGLMMALTGYLLIIVWAAVTASFEFKLTRISCTDETVTRVCYDGSATPELSGIADFYYQVEDPARIENSVLFVAPESGRDDQYVKLSANFSFEGTNLVFRQVNVSAIPLLLNSCYGDGKYDLRLTSSVKTENQLISRSTIHTKPVTIKLLDKGIEEADNCG